MKKNKSIILVIFLFFILILTWEKTKINNTAIITAEKGYLDLSQYDFEKNLIIKLDGEWEFYYNKLYTPQELTSNTIDNKQYFKIPSNLNGTIINEKKLEHYGYMTLRLKVILNDKDINRFLGLKIQDMLTSSKIWINGQLTDYHGVVNGNEEGYKPIFKTTLSIFQPKSKYVEIVIQTANFREPASMIKSLYFGTKNEILKEENIQLSIDLFLFGSIFIISLYHFALFTIRKKDKSNFYFSLFCLDIGIRSLFMGERILVQIFPNMPFELLSKTAAISYYLGLYLFLMFLKQLFSEISDKVIKISKYVTTVMTLVCLVTINKVYDKLAISSQIYCGLIFLYIVYKLIKLLMNKKENAFEMLLGVIIIFIALLCDILGYDGYLTLRFAMPIGVFIFIFIQSYILAKNFSNALTLSEKLAGENKAMYKEIKKMNIELEDKVKDRTKELYNSRKELKNLLDNAKQGFLTFGKDFAVNEVYSIQCRSIFREDIENKKIEDILFNNNLEEKNLFQSIMEEIFNTSDEYKIKILMELLPEEIKINDKNIVIGYKIIANVESCREKIVMLILTDVSEKRQLENKIEEEKNLLKMIVNVVIYYEDSKELINSYNEFCELSLENLLKSNRETKEIYYEILRKIHTFRGNFAQMNMLNTADNLGNIEDNLIKIGSELNIDDLKLSLNKQDINNVIKEELQTIEKILGKGHFDKEKIIVDRKKLKNIEGKIKESFKKEDINKIIPMIRSLSYVSLKEMIVPYGKYIARIGENLGKQIYPFEIQGDDIYVDPDKYHDLVRTMVHIFRNMADHGIESIKDRIEKGKDEYGKIVCSLRKDEKNIIIEISDDGDGIDLQVLKKKIIEKNLLSPMKVEKLLQKELLDYIFTQGLTTRDYCTELSGRGIGLSEFKEAVKRLNGNIEVETKANEGTSFKIIIGE